MANGTFLLREPNSECVFCSQTLSVKTICKALNDIYCAKELNPCKFYKSKYEYNEYGEPLRGGK